jgi:hypothetical protein
MPVLGYTTRRHLILDLDNTTAGYVRVMARRIMAEWPKVGDCLILCSSEKPDWVRLVYNKWGRPLIIHDRHNFHLIFDNGIGYTLSCRICRVLAELGILNEDYVKIREFRGDMTTRVGPTLLYDEVKPPPRVVERVYNNYTTRRDGYIELYLKMKKIGDLLLLTQSYAEAQANYGAHGTDRTGQ